MLIVENEAYICSENLGLTEIARTEFASNFKNTPFRALTDSLKNSSAREIVGLTFAKGVIYLAAKGGAGVKIIRNNTTTTLIKSVDGNVITASGYPKEGDRMLLQLSNIDQGMLELDFELPKIKIGFYPKIKSFFSRFKLKLPGRSIYIKQTLTEDVSPQSKKLTFTVAIILLVLLAVSIGFGIRQKKINDLKNKYQGILSQAQDEVDQAIALASVSSERSRQLFFDAQTKITQIEELNVKDSKLSTLKQKINESRSAILGEYLSTPEMFLDLTLLSSGFKGDSVAFSGGAVYVMDSDGRRVVSVNVSTKKSKVVAGPGVINSAVSLACYEDRVFVLEDDGIYEVDSGNTKIVNKTWSGDALISAFAGNLYVMDKSGGQIFRYQGQGNSFADKQNWLSSSTNVDFSGVKQMTIDGLIYALYPNSKVLKFSQGSPLNFNITGTVPEIGNIDAIHASPDNLNIYLLDKAGKRVVVVDKKGIYKAQYVNDMISGAANIVVSEKDGKIILLTGDKLYSIDIKNL